MACRGKALQWAALPLLVLAVLISQAHSAAVHRADGVDAATARLLGEKDDSVVSQAALPSSGNSDPAAYFAADSWRPVWRDMAERRSSSSRYLLPSNGPTSSPHSISTDYARFTLDRAGKRPWHAKTRSPLTLHPISDVINVTVPHTEQTINVKRDRFKINSSKIINSNFLYSYSKNLSRKFNNSIINKKSRVKIKNKLSKTRKKIRKTRSVEYIKNAVKFVIVNRTETSIKDMESNGNITWVPISLSNGTYDVTTRANKNNFTTFSMQNIKEDFHDDESRSRKSMQDSREKHLRELLPITVINRTNNKDAKSTENREITWVPLVVSSGKYVSNLTHSKSHDVYDMFKSVNSKENISNNPTIENNKNISTFFNRMGEVKDDYINLTSFDVSSRHDKKLNDSEESEILYTKVMTLYNDNENITSFIPDNDEVNPETKEEKNTNRLPQPRATFSAFDLDPEIPHLVKGFISQSHSDLMKPETMVVKYGNHPNSHQIANIYTTSPTIDGTLFGATTQRPNYYYNNNPSYTNYRPFKPQFNGDIVSSTIIGVANKPYNPYAPHYNVMHGGNYQSIPSTDQTLTGTYVRPSISNINIPNYSHYKPPTHPDGVWSHFSEYHTTANVPPPYIHTTPPPAYDEFEFPETTHRPYRPSATTSSPPTIVVSSDHQPNPCPNVTIIVSPTIENSNVQHPSPPSPPVYVYPPSNFKPPQYNPYRPPSNRPPYRPPYHPSNPTFLPPSHDPPFGEQFETERPIAADFPAVPAQQQQVTTTTVATPIAFVPTAPATAPAATTTVFFNTGNPLFWLFLVTPLVALLAGGIGVSGILLPIVWNKKHPHKVVVLDHDQHHHHAHDHEHEHEHEEYHKKKVQSVDRNVQLAYAKYREQNKRWPTRNYYRPTSRPKSSSTSLRPKSASITTLRPKSVNTTTLRPKSVNNTTLRPKNAGITTLRPKSATNTVGPGEVWQRRTRKRKKRSVKNDSEFLLDIR